jgi:hypothetical protein
MIQLDTDRRAADPKITASIYCAGRLDEVIFRVVKPFLHSARTAQPGAQAFVWLIRYGKGGEHVKVRFHCETGSADAFRILLTRSADRFFAAFPDNSCDNAERGWSAAQAIDPEDNSLQAHPDRSLLWTTYHRNPTCLGPAPLLYDDRYVDLCTLCLGQVAEILFGLEPHTSASGLSYRLRQTTLLRTLLEGLGTLDLGAAAKAYYLRYHRDWLIRFFLLKNWSRPEHADALIKVFDRQLQDRALVQPIAELLSHGPEASASPWQERLRAFQVYSTEACQKIASGVDPFASAPGFAPLFKVFHGAANQLGVSLSDEALVHHLLLTAFNAASGLGVETAYFSGEPASRGQ